MVVGVSLSKSHSNIENGTVELQHTITVWYNGSYTNKYNKLTDTSTQVLSNTKIFGFIYWRFILGWYGQPCHKEWTVKITVDPYWVGTVNHATNNKTAKTTVGPYKAGMVNHATNNKTARNTVDPY